MAALFNPYGSQYGMNRMMREQQKSIEQYERDMRELQSKYQWEISVQRIQDPISFKEYEIRYNHRTGEKQVVEKAMIETFEPEEERNDENKEKIKNRRKLFWARYKQNNLIKSLIMAS